MYLSQSAVHFARNGCFWLLLVEVVYGLSTSVWRFTLSPARRARPALRLGVVCHSPARARGPPRSSPGAWCFALPRAALVPLLARGRGASLVRPRAGPPICGTLVSAAGLAQLVEQLSCKQQVIGSSPIAGSIVQFRRIRPVVWLALAGWPVFPCYCGKVGARLIRT